jgi:hypothetical protein
MSFQFIPNSNHSLYYIEKAPNLVWWFWFSKERTWDNDVTVTVGHLNKFPRLTNGK